MATAAILLNLFRPLFYKLQLNSCKFIPIKAQNFPSLTHTQNLYTFNDPRFKKIDLEDAKSNLFTQQQMLFPFNEPKFLKKNNVNFSTESNNLTVTNKSKPTPEHLSDNPSNYVRLMEMNEIFWPGLIKYTNTLLFLNFVMHFRFDKGFHRQKFLYDTLKTVIKVSELLAKGDVSQLKGIVTDEAIKEIERNLKRLNPVQRKQLKVKMENRYYSFVHTFNMRMVNLGGYDRRFVEIICCYHFIYNFDYLKKEHREKNPTGPPYTYSTFLDNQNMVTICNYSFIRDYSEGLHGKWIINRLNHFKPMAVPDPYANLFRLLKLKKY